MKRKYPIVIFEGVEMAGKTWLMSQVYDALEKKNNRSGKILDGCAWINVDVGVLGSEKGFDFLLHKMNEIRLLDDRSVILEKFHISDVVYNDMHGGEDVRDLYDEMEEELKEMGAKLVLVDVVDSVKLFEKRIRERLEGVSHYERIVRNEQWYLQMRKMYEEEFEKSNLDKMRVDLSLIPNQKGVNEVLGWIDG